jgi:hypothetical protein
VAEPGIEMSRVEHMKSKGISKLNAFWAQITSDLICLGRGPNTKKALSFDRSGGDCAQRPDAYFFLNLFIFHKSVRLISFESCYILQNRTKLNLKLQNITKTGGHRRREEVPVVR